jgi:hypothetical protein
MSFSSSRGKIIANPKAVQLGQVLCSTAAAFLCPVPAAAHDVAIIDGLVFHHTPADDKDSHRVRPETCSIRLARS